MIVFAIAGAASTAAYANGDIVAMKGGDRSASNNVSGATNYATGLAGALFEYTTGDPTSGSTTWTAFPSVTNASGVATATNLANGTYYVRERTPGTGFTNFGPVTSLSYNGAQPYVARVTVTNGSTSYAFPHSNTSSTPANWTPTNGNSGTNNGSPFINVRDNGVLPQGCGMNILLVLDRSGSIDPYKSQYEAAAKQFISSLNGTPTQVGIISFNNSVNSYQPAQGSSSFYQSPLSLANAGSATTLNNTITNIYANPTSLTNWDGVLQAASQAKSFTADGTTGQTANPDMVVFITDGNPTTSQASTSSSNEDLINLTSGMASANLVKNQTARAGTKVKLLAIGVGNDITINNLKVVSGPNQGVDGDYANPTIPELSAFLSELAASQCGARVYVRKLVNGQSGNQSGWFYTATDPRPGQSPTYLDNNRATHSSGSPPVIQTGAFFANLPSTPTTINMNEDASGQPMSNFELTSVDCRSGSYTGSPVSGGVKNGLQFSIPVSRGNSIYCTYTNALKTTLSVNKTPDNQTVNAGDDVEFTIQVTNTGGNTATGVTLSDPLPTPGVGGWTITQQPGGNPCSITAGTLNCSFGNLNAAQSASVKVKTGTSFSQCGTYDNVAAQASATNASPVTDGGKITCQKPDLTITKTGNGPINAGQDASFTMTVKNNGPGVAKSVSLSDPLPGGTAGPWTISSQPGSSCSIVSSSLSCNFGDLAAGQQVQVTVKAPTSNGACTKYDNTATTSASNAPAANASASVTCNKPGLGTLKTAVQATISAGDNAQFAITVSNTGPGAATGVTLSDPLPTGVAGAWTIVSQPAGNPCSITAGTLTCNFGDMAASTSKSVTVSAPTDFDHCAQLVNLATASATNAPSASDDATILCNKPNLSVVKTGNGPINAGEDATFTVTVNNAGPGVAKGVTLNDPLPSGTAGAWTIVAGGDGASCSINAGTLSCNFGDMPASTSKTVTVKASTNAANCATYDNTATASATNSPSANDDASVVCRKPNLDVQKTGNGTVNAGEDVQFTVSVSNAGPGTAKSVSLSDPLPAGTAGAWTISNPPAVGSCSITAGTLTCNFGDLTAGNGASVTVKAPTDADHCAKYDNTATATSTNAPSDSASASDQCLKPSLSVTKTGNGTINAGENVVFSLTVQNGGPGVAKSVKLSDPLPTGIAGAWSITSQPAGNPCAIVSNQLNCDFGNLAASDSRSVTVSAATDVDNCGTYDNQATASADNNGPVNDSATVACKKPQLDIVKTGNGPVNAGDDLEFSVTVSNNGQGTAKSVTLNDPLPSGTAGVWTISQNPSQGSCSITVDVLSCNFGDMGSGASTQVKVKAPTSYDACKLFQNTASASATGLTAIEGSASIACQKPNVSTLKTAVQATISAGDTAQFQVKVTNQGPGVAKGVTLSDPLPTGVSGSWSIVSGGDGASCSITAGTLNCDFGDMAASTSKTVTVEAATDFEDCAQLDNEATASADNAPDASDSASINCQKPDLALTKTGNGTVNAGENVTFTLSLKNNGPGVAKAAKINDPLPTGTAGGWTITNQPGSNPCSITAGTLSCDFGDLASGDERSVTVSATTDADHCQVYDNQATATASNHPQVTDSATDTCQKPSVSTLKTAVQATISAGDTAQFEVKVTNAGPGVAKGVTLSDPLPSGVSGPWSIVSGGDGASCSITAGTLNCDFGDMAANTSKTVKVEAATDFENCAELNNQATASADNAPDASDSASINCQKPDLVLTKTGNGTVNAGEDVTFTLTLKNNGAGVAKSATINDPLPTGTAGGWTIDSGGDGASCSITAGNLICAFGDLGAGDQKTVTVRATTDYENCQQYVNQATAVASNHPQVTDSATDNCQKPNTSTLKTAVQPTISAGDTAQFQVKVTNTGPGVAKGVTLSDPLPTGVSGAWSIVSGDDGADCTITAGTLNCDFGDMAANTSKTVTVQAQTDFENCAELNNEATASADNAPDASDSASINCQKPDLVLTKTGNGTVNAGEDVTFTLTLKNNGPGVAKSATINDPLPSGTAGSWAIDSGGDGADCSITAGTLNCDFGDLAASATKTVTVSAATDYENCQVYDNQATAAASNHPQVTASATDTCQKPNTSTLKTAVQPTISAGDTAQFEIKVTNTGPGVAKAVTLSDPLPTGVSGAWSIVSGGDGASCSITAGTLNCDFGDMAANTSKTVKVEAATDFEDCAVLNNQATASADNAPDASDSATINCQKPNLTLTKTGNGTVSAGQDVQFTLTASNQGPGVAKSVVVTDNLPTGTAGDWTVVSNTKGTCNIAAGVLTCDFGDLASGDTASVVVKAPTDADSCGTYENSATAVGGNAPETSDSATDTCQKPTLKLVKKGNGKVDAGQKVKFTITVSNDGPGTATGVKVKDPMPGGTAGAWKIEAQPADASCSISGKTLDCDLGDLAAGDSDSIRVAAPTSDTKCTRYENTAQETAENAAPLTATATAGCNKPDPKLQLRKKANRKKVFPGQVVRYTIMVRNIQKGSVAKNVLVCDQLPSQMTVASRGKGSFFQDGKLCWKIEKLGYSRKWRVFKYSARVNENVSAGTRLKNVVTVGDLRATRTVVVRKPVVSPARRVTPVTG